MMLPSPSSTCRSEHRRRVDAVGHQSRGSSPQDLAELLGHVVEVVGREVAVHRQGQLGGEQPSRHRTGVRSAVHGLHVAGVGADVAAHPALAQPHHDAVAVHAGPGGDQVGLPRVRAIVQDGRELDAVDIGEPLGVAGSRRLPRGEQLGEPAELHPHDRGLHVAEPVVVARLVEGRHGERGSGPRESRPVRCRRCAACGRGPSAPRRRPTSAPPSPLVIPLRPWKLNAARSARLPAGRPLYVAPAEQAASSSSHSPCWSASARSSS